MTKQVADDFWGPLINAFPPESVANLEPLGGVDLTTFLPRPDMKDDLQKLYRSLFPDRGIHKAVLLGQRGCGKSSVLRYLADDLKKTHLVLWLNAIEERKDVLEDPLAFYVTIGLSAMQAMQQNKIEPDRKLFEAFLSACLDTNTSEQEAKKQDSFRLDVFLDGAADIFVTGTQVAGIADPHLLVATIAVGWVRKLLKAFKIEDQKNETLRQLRTIPPQFDKAAGRLTTFIHDCEHRFGKPIVVILDGLDKVRADELESFYQKAREIARPQIRILLTAPETLYTSMDFAETEEFLSLFVVPNIRLGDIERTGENFLKAIISKRFEILGRQVEQVYSEKTLERLIANSGGNIRTLITLVYETFTGAEVKGREFVSDEIAQTAINHIQSALVGKIREEELRALRAFNSQPGFYRSAPSGMIGDLFLRNKFILIYRHEGKIQYALNPLVHNHLQEARQ